MSDPEYYEAGFNDALDQVMRFADYWRWMEYGERGTGEAFAVELAVKGVREGQLPRKYSPNTPRMKVAMQARAREWAEWDRLWKKLRSDTYHRRRRESA